MAQSPVLIWRSWERRKDHNTPGCGSSGTHPQGPPLKFAPASEAGAHKEAANVPFVSQLPDSPADVWQSLPREKKLNVPPNLGCYFTTVIIASVSS